MSQGIAAIPFPSTAAETTQTHSHTRALWRIVGFSRASTVARAHTICQTQRRINEFLVAFFRLCGCGFLIGRKMLSIQTISVWGIDTLRLQMPNDKL